MRAGALGAVEGKELGAGLGQAQVALGADRVGGEEDVLASDDRDDQPAFAGRQSELHGVGQALTHVGFEHQTVHHQIDGMLLVLGQFRHGVQADNLAVDSGPDKALGLEFFEKIGVGSFLVVHHRRQEHELRALGQAEDTVHDLVAGLGLDGGAALGAARRAQACVEDAQKIVDFRDRAHRGARVLGHGLLLQGDGRCQPFDEIDGGLVHLGEKLSGVSREGFHIAPLAFGVDDVEGQGGLARPRRAADDHEPVPWDVQGQVLEVMLARAFDVYDFFFHGCSVTAAGNVQVGLAEWVPITI